MAWEDRTPAQKRQAKREAAAYAASDDDVDYVITSGTVRIKVHGRNSARVVLKSTRGGTIDPPLPEGTQPHE